MKAFFLYTELADYTLLCFKKHLELNPMDEIHVIHYPVNPEAPFSFAVVDRLFLYNKKEHEVPEIWDIFNTLKPDVVLCSGWSDPVYNKFVRSARKLVPVILCFDNFFRFSLKQLIGVPVARILFRGVYSGVWVPGRRQKEYARILGFPEARIFTGFYSTDISKFGQFYQQYLEVKQSTFPKVFLCVARYIPQKGLPVLWEAFKELCAEQSHEWELWCVGSGDGFENRVIHEKIRHLGFIQPDQYGELVRQGGVFILPSLFEPWGVVVNEFAAAGFPLVLSKKVGSSDAFLEESQNGYFFNAGNKDSLKEAMRKIMNCDDDTLNKMGARSVEKAKACSAEMWSQSLISLSKLT